ncbi:uncharacterized protein EURHEDRAFT_408229 [Aspergillus ruber CBS 135680]|uniref:Uncharacterized protein n=1 Tax=Aspergillus ruber (strain CBS 135680) TaxID=1388766 RepID=A0A017SRV5_ASPRC|nr:uncharacterized protein EURHEDRAFT_408229 [Aspergillus ruber CBS 135680]EYE99000.1 hypothetical protein EURHEDRAFT_408229 [Aspergillus ruber CBS 135680]
MHNEIRQLYFLQLSQCCIVRYSKIGNRKFVQAEIKVFDFILTKRFLQPDTRLDTCKNRG